jgi:hypothetical protein
MRLRAWSVGRLALPLLILTAGLTHAAPARAAVVVNERIPIVTTDDSVCLGETFDVVGTLHVLGTLTEDANGGLHFRGSTTFHATAVGLASGATYKIAYHVTHDSNNVAADGTPRTAGVLVIDRVIRRGEPRDADDWRVNFMLHVTINANGTVTADVVHEHGGC